MPSSFLSPPYRACVGVVLVNRMGLVWVGQGTPDCARVDAAGSWRMPQGPVGPDEPAQEAALRVLAKEAGVRSVKVLAEAPGWFTYELPSELIGVALGGEYCGQRQKWVAVRFLGEDGEMAAREGAERAPWRWVYPAQVPHLAPPLKRELYEDVVATFAPFLRAPDRVCGRAERPVAGLLPWFVVASR